MSLIYEKLGTVKYLTNSSLSSVIGEVNRNFTLLTDAFGSYLEALEYDENLNNATFNKLDLVNLQVTELISVGTVDSPDNVTIDANGRITANSFLVEIAESYRMRLKHFVDDLNVPGIPGEMVYIEPNVTYGEGFYGYFQELGWVKIGGTAIGGGGGANFLYELGDVNLTNPQDGSVLIYDVATNKWIDSPYNVSNFFSNLTNLTQYKIPYWNGTSLSNSSASFNPGINLITVDGDFAATTKSFIIDHPSKKGFKLRYGNLEGPEHGVYIRGKSTSKKIELPYYWKDLVDIDSISVNLTPIGRNLNLYVKDITPEYITIGGSHKPNFFFTIFAERKDVSKIAIEIPILK